MAFLLNLKRDRLKTLVARDYNTLLDNSTHYQNVYIHTFMMELSDKHYEEVLARDFPKSSLKHFTMFTDSKDSSIVGRDESIATVPLVISKLDGVSESYNDARPYTSVFYNFSKNQGECYSLDVESVYDPCGEQTRICYFRNFGSRLILFRENVHDYKKLIATGTWKSANAAASAGANNGHYYLGSCQLPVPPLSEPQPSSSSASSSSPRPVKRKSRTLSLSTIDEERDVEATSKRSRSTLDTVHEECDVDSDADDEEYENRANANVSVGADADACIDAADSEKIYDNKLFLRATQDLCYLNDSIDECKYAFKKFIMFTSISNCKEVYDVKHLKNFALDFGGKIVVNQNNLDTFVNAPRLT